MKYNICLVWMVAALAAGWSCADRAQEQRRSCPSPEKELSGYWEGHDFQTREGFSDIDAAEDKFDGFISLLGQVQHETAVTEMTEFLDSAAQNVVAYMVWAGWFEPFLHAKESPYRNDSLFNDIISVCNTSTRVCVAANITMPDAYIKTRKVSEWKKEGLVIGKRPCVFLILA